MYSMTTRHHHVEQVLIAIVPSENIQFWNKRDELVTR